MYIFYINLQLYLCENLQEQLLHFPKIHGKITDE